jgi:hypothetical protein
MPPPSTRPSPAINSTIRWNGINFIIPPHLNINLRPAGFKKLYKCVRMKLKCHWLVFTISRSSTGQAHDGAEKYGGIIPQNHSKNKLMQFCYCLYVLCATGRCHFSSRRASLKQQHPGAECARKGNFFVCLCTYLYFIVWSDILTKLFINIEDL